MAHTEDSSVPNSVHATSLSAAGDGVTPPATFWLLSVPETGACTVEKFDELDALLSRLKSAISPDARDPEPPCYVYVFRGQRCPIFRDTLSGARFLDVNGEKICLSSGETGERLELVEDASVSSGDDELAGFVFDRLSSGQDGKSRRGLGG